MILHLEAKFKELIIEPSKHVDHHLMPIFYQFHDPIVWYEVVSERLWDVFGEKKELIGLIGPKCGYFLVVD